MKKLSILAWAVFAVGCAGTMKDGGTTPDPAQEQSMEAYVRDMFAHLDRGDVQYLKDTACPEAILFDMNEKGMPIAAWTKDEVMTALDGYGNLTKNGGTVHSEITRIACHAGGGRGFCALEFTQTMTMGGQTMTMKGRGTAVNEMYKGHWIWEHWHGSMAEMPPMSAPPAAAPAAAPQ